MPAESIGALIRGILMDVRTLIREEVALARVELRGKAGQARAAAFSLGVAAGALILGATFLLIAASIAIADLLEWPVWAGFLLVAGVLSIVGLVTLSAGKKQLRSVHPVPEETVSTLKENSEWIAKRLSSEPR
jgi:MFS family permease